MQCNFYPKMVKTAKTRIFPDKTLPVNDSKQLSPVSDQVFNKSGVRFRKKMSKNLFFLVKMDKFWTKKGAKNGHDFLSEKKFSLSIFNYKLSLNKKLTKNIYSLDKMSKKAQIYVMSPQIMYLWPKHGQNGENKTQHCHSMIRNNFSLFLSIRLRQI